VDARLAGMSLREKLAAMLMLHYPGTDPDALHDFMASTGAGGFILMGDNVPGTADSVAPVSAALAVDPSLPPLVGIDQEGGDVSRLDDDTFAAGIQLATAPPEETRTAFASRAQLVRAAGANINFGVIADETADSASFIYDRVLGTTPDDAAARVEQAVLGEQGLTISTLKHFPGHGLTEADSHHSLPSSDIPLDAWRTGPGVPFQRGVAAGAGAVMFGHLCLTALDAAPASLSPAPVDAMKSCSASGSVPG
jgi:beta-N-acetylhexosaminidase